MTKSKHRYYSETFKLEVLRDYYSSGMSLKFIIKKWDLSCARVLHYWINQFPVDSELLSLDLETISNFSMSNKEKSKEELLEHEVLRLKKALELEKLRSRAFEKLIEVAEKEEGISILKKGGAKQ